MNCQKLAALLGLLAGLAHAAPEVIDFESRRVVLERPAERIVALAPHIVENVFAAGAGDKLVGVVAYSDYPPEAGNIPQVGNFKAWSLETIASLEPDLILMWSSGNGLQNVATLETLGVPVYASEPRVLKDIPRAIRDIGRLAGTETVSEPEAARFERDFAQLQAKYAGKPPVTVLYQVWNEPLQTLNGDHIISRVMELCGARNAFADAVSLAPKINIESVLARDPDVIVASGMGTSRPEWLDDWRAYPHLTAVRREALLFVHPDIIQRPTPRILLGARDLCVKLEATR